MASAHCRDRPRRTQSVYPHCLSGLWQWSTETAFHVSNTKLAAVDAADAIRGHWKIETTSHYSRDVTFGEDKSRIRTNPGVFARLRSSSATLQMPETLTQGVSVALPIDAVEPSDGATQSANCCRYRPPMPIGWRRFPKACWTVLPPRRSKPLSSSTLPTLLASNRPAAMAAISNAPERRMRQLCREEIASGCATIGRDYLTRTAAP